VDDVRLASFRNWEKVLKKNFFEPLGSPDDFPVTGNSRAEVSAAKRAQLVECRNKEIDKNKNKIQELQKFHFINL